VQHLTRLDSSMQPHSFLVKSQRNRNMSTAYIDSGPIRAFAVAGSALSEPVPAQASASSGSGAVLAVSC